MSEGNNTKQYWKEIGLVILGALLASIPTLTSTYMQSKAEMQRLIFDRQIATLKEWSICENKMATNLLPAIDTFEREIDSVYERDGQGTMASKEYQYNMERALDKLVKTQHVLAADYNAQRLAVNALFHVNLEPMEFYSPPAEVSSSRHEKGDHEPNSLEETKKELEEYKKELKASIVFYKKVVNESLNTSQKLMDKLCSKINY